MNVLILHGIMGRSGENWGQWLHDKLISNSYSVLMPTLSNADHPSRKKWLAEISNFMMELGQDTVIVAHSLAVTSSLDFLEETGHTVKGFVSISGFADDYGLELNSYFLREKTIKFDQVNENVGEAIVFYGDNDPYVPQDSLRLLADNLKVVPVVIPGGGHLNTAAGFTKFPKLLEAILSI